MLILDRKHTSYLREFTLSNAYTGITTNEERLTVARPVCGIDDKLYKFKFAYQVVIQNDDIEALCDEDGYCTVTDFLDYVSKNHFEGKKLRTFFSKNMINAKTIIKKRILVVNDEEKELVTRKTMRDERFQAEQENDKATAKMIDVFLLKNMKTIGEKYGITMREGDNSFRFKDEKAWNEFIINALEETFFKEIKALGVIPTSALEDKERAMVCYSKILRLKDCKLDFDEGE